VVSNTGEVFRNERVLAFKDIGPIPPGHLQIIPTAHIECFENKPEDISCEIMLQGQKLAVAQKKVFGVERVALQCSDGDAAHAHAHLILLVEKDDVTSRHYIEQEAIAFNPIPNPGNYEPRTNAGRIADALIR
jgi:histidine triad (HIT) family protein